jgi:hypothetical protein
MNKGPCFFCESKVKFPSENKKEIEKEIEKEEIKILNKLRYIKDENKKLILIDDTKEISEYKELFKEQNNQKKNVNMNPHPSFLHQSLIFNKIL